MRHTLDSQSRDGRRAIAWIAGCGLAALALSLFLIGGLLATRAWFVQPDGRPAPADFLAYYTASRLALAGEAAALFDLARSRAEQAAAAGPQFERVFPWFYPPSILPFIAPLSLLPFLVAWGAWIAATAIACLAALRPVLGRLAVPVGLGAPAAFWCTVFGQNGFLVGALMAATLTCLDRRPVLAGVWLGLLTCKPQFGPLFALVVLATGRWRVALSAAATALALAIGSGLAFGWDAWGAFLETSRGGTGAILMDGAAGWSKLQSVFALAHAILGDRGLALALHGAVALGVAALVLALWRRPARPMLRNAALVAGAVLVSPYSYVYDAVLLVVAGAFLLRDMLDHGARGWQATLLAVALLLPAGLIPLGSLPGPLAGGLLLGLAWRRAANIR